MRTYSAAENCLLLLYGLPVEGKRLRPQLFRRLFQALSALGAAEGAETGDELTEQELLRLGCTREEAETVLHRLAQEDALEPWRKKLFQMGVVPLTRISPEYPQRLRETLGDQAPLVLFCGGNLSLFSEPCISLVGSRQLREKGKAFASAAGNAIGEGGCVYCSGGARGADTIGYQSCLRAGGRAVVFLADSLIGNMTRDIYGQALAEGRVLLVSEDGWDELFSTPRALSRNRLIHALGEKVLVAQTDYGTGGTWNGTMENLKAGWSPVLVSAEEPEDPGAKGLAERGGILVSIGDLADLGNLGSGQMSLL